ncbi:MAG TPA: hypothetical protein VET90_08865 [Candidatus Binatus sp.]|nr:hypothetical protein [Candidatus Binatus sp.]
MGRPWRTLVLAAGAAVVAGCVARAQGFEARNATLRAEVSDRTGSVASIRLLDRPGTGGVLAAEAVRLSNLDPETVEVAWLGGPCLDEARFSLAPQPADAIGLRYEIGGPCALPGAAGYALQIRFRSPVDAATIQVTSDWGP